MSERVDRIDVSDLMAELCARLGMGVEDSIAKIEVEPGSVYITQVLRIAGRVEDPITGRVTTQTHRYPVLSLPGSSEGVRHAG